MSKVYIHLYSVFFCSMLLTVTKYIVHIELTCDIIGAVHWHLKLGLTHMYVLTGTSSSIPVFISSCMQVSAILEEGVDDGVDDGIENEMVK